MGLFLLGLLRTHLWRPLQAREVGVSSALFLQVVTDLVTVIPVTSTNRGWANHVPVPTLGPDSVAMTEQIRTISRSRITKYGPCVDEESFATMKMWIRDFLT